jgi:hypothetical protein
MPEPDIRFRTYLKAFFNDWLTGMSGPLSVPFAAAAVWSSGLQRVLWGCLAVVAAAFGSYRVWRKERGDANAQLGSLRAAKDSEIAALNKRVAELSRKPHSEDLERHVRQAGGGQMTHNGHLLLRWLLIQGRIHCPEQFIPDISLDTQHKQMEIAVKAGIVRREQEQAGLRLTFYVVNPEIKPVLERVLPEIVEAKTT